MKKTLKNLNLLAFLLGALFLLTFTPDLAAQGVEKNFDYSAANADNNFVKDMMSSRASNISPALGAVIANFGEDNNMEDEKGMMVRSGKILVEIVANTPEEAQTLLADLSAMGMSKGVAFQRVINGMMDINKLEDASRLNGLRWMNYVPTPLQDVGSVSSQGSEAMGLDPSAAERDFRGDGVKVGVLSDAFNSQGGAPAGIASGDLPGPGNPFGRTTPVEVIEDDLFPGNIDEGRAMLEIVHDVAPKADLAFATAFTGRAGFANNVRRLRNEANCDIIVDDIFYLNAAVYQDGLVAQAVDEVTADGAKYFTSAGNSSNRSYENPLNQDGAILTVNPIGQFELHDFGNGGGDYFQEIEIVPFGGFSMSLWWDDPFFSVSGAPGASSDLDIFLIDGSNTIVAGSINRNVGGDAVEFFSFTNFSGMTQTYRLAIGRFVPALGVPSTIKYTLHRISGINAIEYANEINKGTSFAHSNAKGAMAVGAARYDLTPGFGVSPATPEGFTSFGGIPILFDTDGNRLVTPEDRMKPDFVGPDGANTTFFGQDFEPDGFPNFFGTSASAPHLAALAALAQQASIEQLGVEPSNEEIRQLFIQASEDMEDPGFDSRTGAGFVRSNEVFRIISDQVAALPAMPRWLLAVFGLVIITVAAGRFLKF